MRKLNLAPSGRRWRWPTTMVLVVDDNRDAANMLALLLRHWGYRVLVAHSGATALGLVEAEWPALAILDINMPAMSGIELARRLKQRAQGRPLPLYAVSAIDLTLSGTPLHDFQEYLLKPTDVAVLRRLLEQGRSKAIHDPTLN